MGVSSQAFAQQHNIATHVYIHEYMCINHDDEQCCLLLYVHCMYVLSCVHEHA